MRWIQLFIVFCCTPLFCGFTTEAEAWGAQVDAFFASGIDAGSDCDAVDRAMQAWLSAHDAEAVESAAAFATAIEETATEEDVRRVEQWLNTFWDEVGQQQGLVVVGSCFANHEGLVATLQAFDSVITAPVSVALEEATVRVGKQERGADTDLATLAADTLLRTLQRYREVVEFYRDDCDAMAQHMDQWQVSYFRLLDSPAKDVSSEVARMSDEQRSAFQPQLDRIEAFRNVTTPVWTCVDKLDGELKERLNIQTALIDLTIDAAVR